MASMLIGACQEGGDYAAESTDEATTQEAEPMETATMAEPMTVTGTLVDTKCYGMDHANTGNDHGGMAGCGTACTSLGIPVALLEGGEAGGTAHVLLVSVTGLAEHIAKEARVTGMVTF